MVQAGVDMNIFEQTPPNRRRYGACCIHWADCGVVSAFVKWGQKFHCHHVVRLICLMQRVVGIINQGCRPN